MDVLNSNVRNLKRQEDKLNETFPERLSQNYYKLPEVKKKWPWRTLLLALVLFAIGSIFICISCSVFWNTSLYESIPFGIVGGICFIPGSYYTFMFFQIWRQKEGWSIDDVPLVYDDPL